MLKFDIFLTEINKMAVTLGFELTKEWLKIMHEHIKEDFTDETFIKSCELIIRRENLYGKPPIPQLFYKYNPQADSLEEHRNRFLTKVLEYVSENFVSSYEKQDFLDNLTINESKALNEFGGISTLWSDVHNGNLNHTILRRQLITAFDEVYRKENNIVRIGSQQQDKIENSSTNLVKESVKNLTKN